MPRTNNKKKRERQCESPHTHDKLFQLLDHSEMQKTSQLVQAESDERGKRRRTAAPEPERWQSTLPAEVWDQIIEHLPPIDVGSLGLVSYLLYQRFGKDALQTLRKPSQHVETQTPISAF